MALPSFLQRARVLSGAPPGGLVVARQNYSGSFPPGVPLCSSRGILSDPSQIPASGLVTNLIRQSEAIVSGSAPNTPWTWNNGAGSGPVVCSVVQGTDPFGNAASLSRLQIPATAGPSAYTNVFQQVTGPAGIYRWSVWLKTGDGSASQPCRLRMYDTASRGALSVAVTASWQRFSGTATTGVNPYFLFGNSDAAFPASDVLVWGAQVEAVDALGPSTYVPTTTASAAIATSCGVRLPCRLADPEDWGVGVHLWKPEWTAADTILAIGSGVNSVALTTTAGGALVFTIIDGASVSATRTVAAHGFTANSAHRIALGASAGVPFLQVDGVEAGELSGAAVLSAFPANLEVNTGANPSTKILKGLVQGRSVREAAAMLGRDKVPSRFLWSALAHGERASSAFLTGYSFSWASDPVLPSAVRRVRQPLAGGAWTYDALAVHLPADWENEWGTRQFRDISWLRDTTSGRYYLAVGSLSAQATGWRSRGFSIFSSADGLSMDFVSYVDLPSAGYFASYPRVWSPEFFVDDDDAVYAIVSGNSGVSEAFDYHLLRCSNVETFASWAYVCKLSGSAFPRNGAGNINMIDPYLCRVGDRYAVVWKCETASGGTEELGQLGIAYAPLIAGPYDTGNRFVTEGAANIVGEGPSLARLPDGRWRLSFDDYLGRFAGGGQCYAFSSDLATFTTPTSTGLATYNRHSTFVLGP